MAKQGINTGTSPNDGLGDSLLAGAVKINSNFSEIYNTFGNGSNLSSYVSIAGYSTSSGVSTSATSATTAGYATTSGIATVAQGLTGTPNINVGVITATSYNGSGVNLTGIVTSIVAGTNITVSGSTGQVTINSTASASASSIDLLEVMLFS